MQILPFGELDGQTLGVASEDGDSEDAEGAAAAHDQSKCRSDAAGTAVVVEIANE